MQSPLRFQLFKKTQFSWLAGHTCEKAPTIKMEKCLSLWILEESTYADKIRQGTGGCLAFALYLTSSASKDAPATLTSTVLRTLPPSTPPRVLLSSHTRILRHLCMDQAMPLSRIPFYTVPYNGSTYLLRPNPKDASARRTSAITPVRIMTVPSPPPSHSVLCHSIHVTLSSMRLGHGRAVPTGRVQSF